MLLQGEVQGLSRDQRLKGFIELSFSVPRSRDFRT
jgi:hypothetical protein